MSYGVSQTRSIRDIVESLKTSFRSTDYSAAVIELTSREDSLRREKDEIVARLGEKYEILEAKYANLKRNVVLLEDERRWLRRDCDENEDKLSLLKEKEEKTNKRYDCLLNDVRLMEEDRITLMDEKIALMEEKDGLRDNLGELKRSLSEKEVMIEDLKSREAQIDAKLGELEELRRTNARLVEEKVKHDAYVEEVTREKDESIEELLNKLEDAKKLLEAEHKAVRENLEEQKAKVDAQEEERRRNNLEKDDQIRKLEKDIESSNMEKRRLTEQMELVNKRFSKLEEDVITCMCLDVQRDKRFASTCIGKIISGIIQALDSEEIGHTCNAGVKKDRNAQEADSTSNSRVNESICRLKSDKRSAEDVRRTLDFKSESQREDGAIDSKKSIIIIEDSDDEDEIPRYTSDANNKRKRLGTMNDQHNNEGSNDDSLNRKHKIMKVEHLHCEHVKQESSPAALSVDKDGYKFSSERQTPATIKRCVETLSREVGGLSSLQGDNDSRKGNESKYKDGTPKADELCSPQTKDYMSNIRQKRQNKRLECPADMLLAFDKDDDFCTKAVCALYRQHNIGSGIGGSTRFEESDWERVKNLAEFLSDGDPSGKPKKSVVELQSHDPKGLVDCRHFARKYCKGLIGIYKKKVDPLFSPSSIDLQYT